MFAERSACAKRLNTVAAVFILSAGAVSQAAPVGTAFTYQGLLPAIPSTFSSDSSMRPPREHWWPPP
jgi:hypothetical protein